MEFPITNLLRVEHSEQWLMEHFHPERLKCPYCQSQIERTSVFRITQPSDLKARQAYTYEYGSYNSIERTRSVVAGAAARNALLPHEDGDQFL